MDRISKAVERAKEQAQSSQRRFDENVVGPALDKKSSDLTDIQEISISQAQLRENRVIFGEGKSASVHAYKVLRTRVWQKMRSNRWNSVAITSASAGEGKTTTALNLALSMSKMDIKQQVILIDLNLRNPALHKMLGFWPENALGDYFQGLVPLESVIYRIGLNNLIVLPGNVPLANSSEVLSSRLIEQLFLTLKTFFPKHLILFDLPPVLVADDVLVFDAHVDSYVFVIEENKSKMSDIIYALDFLNPEKVIGTVLNKGHNARNEREEFA